MLPSVVPLPLENPTLNELLQQAKEWCLSNGVVMRTADAPTSSEVVNYAPFILLPSPFPRTEFARAKAVQRALNKLVHAVAMDFEFLKESLMTTLPVDDFTKRLFSICEMVETEGLAQDIHLGLLRSDYMLDKSLSDIKQIEINTISVSFPSFACKISSLHRFIFSKMGLHSSLDLEHHLPRNLALAGYAKALVEAWQLYDNDNAAIVIVVQEAERNIADQRLLEYEICAENASITVWRRTFRELAEATLHPEKRTLSLDDREIAVVYYRDGYAPTCYVNEQVWETRLKVERSMAIKCPSIQYQLVGTKKIQQVLSLPNVLEKFLHNADEVHAIRSTFAQQYSLDFDAAGDKAVALAISDPERFVLKPQREGGGNNVYGSDIVEVLSRLENKKERASYILMDFIHPLSSYNYVVRAGEEVRLESVVSELGIFGTIIGKGKEIVVNEHFGHLLRTKKATAQEVGVSAGFGTLDSPYLVY